MADWDNKAMKGSDIQSMLTQVYTDMNGKQDTLSYADGKYGIDVSGTADHLGSYGYCKCWPYRSEWGKNYALLAQMTSTTTTNWAFGQLFKVESRNAFAIFKVSINGTTSAVSVASVDVLYSVGLTKMELEKLIVVRYGFTPNIANGALVNIYTDVSLNLGSEYNRVTLRQLDNHSGGQYSYENWQKATFYEHDLTSVEDGTSDTLLYAATEGVSVSLNYDNDVQYLENLVQSVRSKDLAEADKYPSEVAVRESLDNVNKLVSPHVECIFNIGGSPTTFSNVGLFKNASSEPYLYPKAGGIDGALAGNIEAIIFSALYQWNPMAWGCRDFYIYLAATQTVMNFQIGNIINANLPYPIRVRLRFINASSADCNVRFCNTCSGAPGNYTYSSGLDYYGPYPKPSNTEYITMYVPSGQSQEVELYVSKNSLMQNVVYIHYSQNWT